MFVTAVCFLFIPVCLFESCLSHDVIRVSGYSVNNNQEFFTILVFLFLLDRSHVALGQDTETILVLRSQKEIEDEN